MYMNIRGNTSSLTCGGRRRDRARKVQQPRVADRQSSDELDRCQQKAVVTAVDHSSGQPQAQEGRDGSRRERASEDGMARPHQLQRSDLSPVHGDLQRAAKSPTELQLHYYRCGKYPKFSSEVRRSNPHTMQRLL